MTGINPLANRPKLEAWFNRVKDQLEPHFTKYHKYVYVVEELMKGREE